MFSRAKIAALDITGIITIKKLGLKCDIEFAQIDSTIDAVQRGLNVVVFGTYENIQKLLSNVDELNAKSIEKIKYKLIKI